MGQAKILSGGPAGLYNIELVQETTKATARLAAIKDRLEGTDGDPHTSPPKPATIGLIAAISTAAAAVSVAETALAAARAGLNSSINATKEETGKGSLIAVPRWYNKGNGTCTKANPGSTTRVGRYSMECISVVASPKYASFAVTDTLGSPLPEAQAGTAYANAEIKFTITFGSTDYQTGDAFDIEVASGQETPAVTEQSASEKVVNATKTLAGSRRVLSLLKLEQTSLLKERTALQAAVVPVVKNDVWCADLTTNLAANRVVGTIEVNGEASPTPPIIMPAGAAGLGRLQPSQASTPAGVFVNWALMPCWQRWRPTYRIGTITALNPAGTICTVLLDEALSSAQDLNINTVAGGVALSGVPIDYMRGADVFVVGDRVVIAFTGQAWTSPKVIGFESHPRGPRAAVTGAYYIFYLAGATLKIAKCNYAETITIIDTKSYGDIYVSYFNNPVKFHLKRFSHIPVGETVARDMYFLATSLYFAPDLYLGWKNFAASNPSFPLVTNTANTQITETPQLMSDLNTVNAAINATRTKIPGPPGTDVWKILAAGEGGDCADFAVTKAKALLDLGYPASAIHIECGQTDATPSLGHAWVVVQTTGADYALDVNSDAVGVNSALRYSPTVAYVQRLRQIGMRWAAISPFAWLTSAANMTPASSDIRLALDYATCWYVLDPLLNILYPMGSDVHYEPFKKYDDIPYDAAGWSSVNFSADNQGIYMAELGVIREYRVSNNQLALISTKAYAGNGFVGRDGNIVAPDEYGDGNIFTYFGWGWGNPPPPTPNGSFTAKKLASVDIASRNGYYDYAYKYKTGTASGDGYLTCSINFAADTEPPSSYQFSLPGSYGPDILVGYQHATIGKTFGVPFYWHQDWLSTPVVYWRTPFGETINMNNPGNTASSYPYFWEHIDTDNLLIQSFIMHVIYGVASPDIKRIYKDGVEITGAVAAAVGVAADKILGLVYLPGTDRLN